MSIKDLLNDSNEEYRTTGECKLTDEEYDFLLDKFGDDKQKSAVGVELSKDKVELPVKMGSLNKVKTVKEIEAWRQSKDIPAESLILITPKYDGLSLLVEFKDGKFVKAFTRGNGIEGQDVTGHFAHNSLGSIKLSDGFSGYVYGEAIMRNSVFEDKYSKKYKNPRNMVAGLLNRKKTVEQTKDISFMAFGIKDDSPSRRHQLEYLNKEINNVLNGINVGVVLCNIEELNEVLENHEKMKLIPSDYQCDGLVVEVSLLSLQEKLGKETNSLNPAYGRAWKPQSVNHKVTTVKGVRWQVSKVGYLKPVVEIEPVEISGVTISNVTGNNANYILENNIQKDTVVTIIRSGDVIPKIIHVVAVEIVALETTTDPLPDICPSCNRTQLAWSKTHTELICCNSSCPERIISAMVHFFDTLEIEAIREGTIKQLYLNGNCNIETVCNMTAKDFMLLDGFQSSKAYNCFNAIRDKLIVDLEKLQHACNIFEGLGSRKLKLLREYNSADKVPDRKIILAIEGFSDRSADVYLNNIEKFWELAKKLPFKIKEFTVVTGGALEGKSFVFTGFRDKELAEKIEILGGKIASGVSTKTAYLVCGNKGSGSTKEAKALEVGATILDRSECIIMVASL